MDRYVQILLSWEWMINNNNFSLYIIFPGVGKIYPEKYSQSGFNVAVGKEMKKIVLIEKTMKQW